MTWDEKPDPKGPCKPFGLPRGQHDFTVGDCGRCGARGPRCLTCKRPLNIPGVPESQDCGGDCLQCMADCVVLGILQGLGAVRVSPAQPIPPRRPQGGESQVTGKRKPKAVQLRCYCCGEPLGEVFTLVTMQQVPDRVFLMRQQCAKATDATSKVTVERTDEQQ